MDYDDQPSADEIVEQSWPYDGPHSAEKTAAAAAVIERLVRYMNNATRTPRGVPYAATVGSVVLALRDATALQKQLLEQLTRRLTDVADDPQLYDWIDNQTPASDTALQAVAALRAANEDRRLYQAALDEAAELTGRLSGGSGV